MLIMIASLWDLEKGSLCRGPYTKDCSMLGSMSGFSYLGKLPYIHIHIYLYVQS